MSAKPTKKEPGVIGNQSTRITLQQEAEGADESAWIFAPLKIAILYLGVVTAYVVAVIGLVAAWKRFAAETGEKADITIYMVSGVLTLPLILAFLFNLLPTMRRRSERGLRPTTNPDQKADAYYFQTGPRTEDPYGFFAIGYEPFLEWARRPQSPLLHLSGPSGSGKSSLLSAYLKPHLEKPALSGRTILLTIRSYEDPLVSFKKILLGLWKKAPTDFDTLSPIEALQRAARQLNGSDRLLIVFDQIEELFLRRANLSQGSKESHGNENAVPAVGEEIARFRAFLLAFLADPPERIALLLSYREDHHRLLVPLELPLRQEGVNWMTVDPFDFSTAAKFLRSCPGLTIPEARMQRVLREAARQEGGRVIMRPIVANLLGVVLRRMADHPTLWRQKGDLLRRYVRDCLGKELKEERAGLLRALVTDFHTARPRSVADMAHVTGLEVAVLEAQLDHFGRAGLLRCLKVEEVPAQRVWQISHDFLATLIERVLDGVQRTLWRSLRPWVAPSAVGFALVVFLVQPWIQKQLDANVLANAGFSWSQRYSAITAAAHPGKSIINLGPISVLLHRANPRYLDLTGCRNLQNLNDLQGLTALQTLHLNDCSELNNLDGLKGLTSLAVIDLSGCRALQNLNGLQGLTSLRVLLLSDSALQNLDLRGLISLERLELVSCKALQNLDLRGLASLEKLELVGCKALQNLDGLKGLTALQKLYLRDCSALQNLDGLKGLTALQALYLYGCSGLKNLDGLEGLTTLETLYLNGCSGLQNLDGLQGLTSLRSIGLARIPFLQNLDGLKGLTSLAFIDLSGCSALQNLDGLKGLTALKFVDLSGCSALHLANLIVLIKSLPTDDVVLPDGSYADEQRE